MENLVALVQITSTDDVRENLKKIEGFVQQARQSGAKMVLLPECCGFMQKHRTQLRQTAEGFGQGMIQDALSGMAKEHSIWVLAGSVPIQSNDTEKVINTCLVYDDLGVIAGRYDKIHLFDVELEGGERYAESEYTLAGSELVVIDTPVGKMGLTICYDLRFPEHYRALVNQGAEILTVPSAFAVPTGKAHWHTLLKSRAIENTCYVLAPAQVGEHASGRRTFGHTVAYDPWGKTLAEKSDEGEGLVMVNLDPDSLSKVRNQLPSLKHQRPELFNKN